MVLYLGTDAQLDADAYPDGPASRRQFVVRLRSLLDASHEAEGLRLRERHRSLTRNPSSTGLP